MRFLILVTAILASTMLVRCSSSSTQPDTPPDISDALSEPQASSPPSAATSAGAAPETSEADLTGEANQAQPQPPVSTTQEPPPPVAAAPTLEPAPEAPPAPAPAPAESEPPAAAAPIAESGEAAKITNLEFLANVNGGTVAIHTDKPVQYTSRRNDRTRQFIIELQNTVIPRQYQRPYITKEFGSNIASINGYQAQTTPPSTRIVVQLRDLIDPGVTQEGNVVNVAAAGGGPASPPPAESPPVAETAPGETAAQASGEQDGASIQTSSSLNDFLTGNIKFYGKPINIEVTNTDIRDLLRFISEQSGLNIVMNEDVQGKVSIKLRNVPWDQALHVILQSKQLGYMKQGSILRIAPLKTLQQEADAAKTILDSQKAVAPLRVQLFPISYAKVEDIETQVKDFLSTRGKARGDKRTNTLVVTDVDEEIARIKTLVKKLDTQTPQVLIEAKVIEARDSYNKTIGVNWGWLGQQMNLGSNSQGNQVTLTPGPTSLRPGESATNYNIGMTVGNMDVFGDLTATLRLLETESLVKVISAPRIVTLDRNKAHIEQTTQFPVFSTSVTTTGVPAPTVTFQDVKLILEVTPQITNDGGIIMDVALTREFPGDIVPNGTAQARPVNKRNATTQVLVENGDTVVIGGIYQSDVTETETGLPWLRKIPIIGALFRQRDTDKTKNELVIFLTPRVLNREKAFAERSREGGT